MTMVYKRPVIKDVQSLKRLSNQWQASTLTFCHSESDLRSILTLRAEIVFLDRLVYRIFILNFSMSADKTRPDVSHLIQRRVLC